MPLDALGLTHTTLHHRAGGPVSLSLTSIGVGNLVKLDHAGMDQFLVGTNYQLELIMSMSFVHTAHCYY